VSGPEKYVSGPEKYVSGPNFVLIQGVYMLLSVLLFREREIGPKIKMGSQKKEIEKFSARKKNLSRKKKF